MTPEEQAAKAMEALDRSITWNRQLLDERNLYKAALEKIAAQSCCDEVCISPCSSDVAKEALQKTDESGDKK